MTTDKQLILIVDDNEDARYALERIVAHSGYSVLGASSGPDALEKARHSRPALIFLDLMMPGMDGFEVTRKLKNDDDLKFTPIILVTARDSYADIAQGLDQGADDYIVKPFRTEELLARLRAALRLKHLYSELRDTQETNTLLMSELSGRFDPGAMIGSSPAMRRTFALLDKVSAADAPVLISGESGTGKELAARAIHFNSTRRSKPFIARNCAAMSEHLLESELFGHTKGAFTSAIRDQKGIFEAADGGTLFLDEIGEMSLSLQPKLLRVLQEGTFTPVGSMVEKKVSVRVLAATNRNLEQMVDSKTFREDLFYRLSVVNIELPRLADRREDIPALVDFFLSRGADARAEKKKPISPEAMRALVEHVWRGNVRELQNEIERMCILGSDDTVLGVDLLSDRVRRGLSSEAPATDDARAGLKSEVEALERKLIIAALEKSEWNKSDAARQLGISRSNLLEKVKSYGLKEPSE
ncbi:MAG: sigma-54-dependent Fis family transcriptional regulator [Deltaproteobacteria bacterium]|nr:sigma-54-dependent Fis family transcriptional regulator [Deltaproteobacteria bacterium]